MSSTLFTTTVCPVDFSDYSVRALLYAIVLAGRLGGRVTILHVVNPLLLQAAAAAYDVAAMSRDTDAELRTLANAITSDPGAGRPGPEVRTAVRVGDPATEIISCGEEEHADLIVMGTHGRSGYRRMFYGSVTEQVLRRSSVPVLAVPPSGLEREDALAEASVVSGERRHL